MAGYFLLGWLPAGHYLEPALGQQFLPLDIGLCNQVLELSPVHNAGVLPDTGTNVLLQLDAEMPERSLGRGGKLYRVKGVKRQNGKLAQEQQVKAAEVAPSM